MAVPINIVDPLTGRSAKIVNGGAVAVLPPEYNLIFSVKMDVAGQVYNLVPPKPNNYFIGNLLIMTANKNVGVNDATISIYAASAADEALGAGNIEFLSTEMVQKTQIVIPGMNVRTLDAGAYINCVTDDNDVYVTLFGYYTSEI